MLIATREKLVRILNTIWIYVLFFVLLGAYIYQYSKHQNPCPLCEMQRISMILVSIGPILNIRFGIYALHYGISVIFAIFGGVVALRQISLHICPNFPRFGDRVFGLELYTWAFLVFVASIFAIGCLLTIYLPNKENISKKLVGYEKVAIILIILISLSNAITTFLQCGIGPCVDT